MMRSAFVFLLAGLIGACTAHAVKESQQEHRVVILGNHTTPAHCECNCKAAQAEAARWKAYAEKLEQQLAIHGGQP